MSDNNELMKKDLVYILQLNNKINYNNYDEVNRAHSMALQKNLFRTTLGQRYMKRLEQILDGTYTSNKCVLCGKDLDNSSLVCSSCLTKYRLTPVKKEDTIQTEQKASVKKQQTLKRADQPVVVSEVKKKPAKKKIKKRTIIAFVVIFLIFAGIASDESDTSNNDLIDMMGMTEDELQKEYGKPDSIDTMMGMSQGVYEDGVIYTIRLDGLVCAVSLTGGKRKLAGISLGDSVKKVAEMMQKAGADFSSQEIIIENNQQVLLQEYQKGHYNLDIRFDNDTKKVIGVNALYY